MERGTPVVAPAIPVDFDGLCQKIRASVEPARAHAVSLHDEHGDVIWLSEGSLGPDEHDAVRAAIDAFSRKTSPPIFTHDLGGARSALLLRATNARRAMVGVIMLVMDTRMLKKDAKGVVHCVTPLLQHALTEFARVQTGDDVSLQVVPPSAGAAAKSAAPSTPPKSTPAEPAPVNPAAPAISPEIERLHAALLRSPIALHVQRLVPLTKGSKLKRYEVLLRSKSETAPNAAPHAMLKAAVDHGLGSMIDRRVITELITWLVHNPSVWQANGIMFSVNLTSTALYDEHFMKFVDLCLTKSKLPKGTVAFEIDVPSAIKPAARIADVAASLQRIGCPLVLDDFALRTECFELLRLPGVRIVKLASAITTQMRTDKVCQAAITAVVQMARVLGMHTVAKRTEVAAEQEWLTALGVDFVQSHALSPPVSIETLAKSGKPQEMPQR
jgi:EAL domain-containing protein (putative c-di-GMP-specific phosphodiesterase class I)